MKRFIILIFGIFCLFATASSFLMMLTVNFFAWIPMLFFGRIAYLINVWSKESTPDCPNSLDRLRTFANK